MAKISRGHCGTCGAVVPFVGAKLDRHEHDGAECPGSFRPARGGAPRKRVPMTAAERRTARRLFG